MYRKLIFRAIIVCNPIMLGHIVKAKNICHCFAVEPTLTDTWKPLDTTFLHRGHDTTVGAQLQSFVHVLNVVNKIFIAENGRRGLIVQQYEVTELVFLVKLQRDMSAAPS